MRPSLRDLISEQFHVPGAELQDTDGPQRLPGWDSAAHVELILRLEKKFGIRFTDEEAVGLVTLQNIDRALTAHGVAL